MRQRLEHTPLRAMTVLRTACMTAILAVPLAACSDRPADTGATQVDAQQAAREKPVERREGKEQPSVAESEEDYTDRYSEPRESWTGGATAGGAEFKASAETDARAEQLLERTFDTRDELSAIDIDVEDGVARLEGEVMSALERHDAEQLAMSVEGIFAVRNELQIAPPPN